MTTPLDRAMLLIKKEILSLGAVVEDRFRRSVIPDALTDFG
jgi:hypothetical protein